MVINNYIYDIVYLIFSPLAVHTLNAYGYTTVIGGSTHPGIRYYIIS